MKVLLWVIQIALALLYLAGGAYKVFSIDEWASAPWFGVLPRSGWSALGVIEVVGAVLLVAPVVLKWKPGLTSLAAAALALETLALAGLYARYSLEMTAANPLVWSLVMGLLAACVAYARYALNAPAARPTLAH